MHLQRAHIFVSWLWETYWILSATCFSISSNKCCLSRACFQVPVSNVVFWYIEEYWKLELFDLWGWCEFMREWFCRSCPSRHFPELNSISFRCFCWFLESSEKPRRWIQEFATKTSFFPAYFQAELKTQLGLRIWSNSSFSSALIIILH